MAHIDDLAKRIRDSAQVFGNIIRPQFSIRSGQKVWRAVDPKEFRAWCRSHGLSVSQFNRVANSYRTGIGRAPGRGFILLNRAQLDQLGSPQTVDLLIEEARPPDSTEPYRGAVIEGLTIEREEAIHPGYNPRIEAEHKTPSDSVYIVHLVDWRDRLKHAPADTSYNLLYGHNESVYDDGEDEIGYTKPDLSQWTVKEILDDLASKLNLTLSYYDDTDELLDFQPEGFRFIGTSALDALNAVLAAYSLRLGVGNDGTPWVLPADLGDISEFDKALSTILPGGKYNRLVEHKGFDHQPDEPSRVEVYFPNRDFQYHLYAPTGQSGEQPRPVTGEEVLQLYPFYKHSWDNQAAPNGPVHHLWGALPRIRGDSGESNDDLLNDHADALAQQHANAIAQWEDWKEYTFTGFLDHEATGPFSGVAWFDFGDGGFTKLYRQPMEFNPFVSLNEFALDEFLETVREPIELQSGDPYPSAPDVIRKHPVSTRLVQGVCVDQSEVQQNQEGDFSIYFGQVGQGTTVNWSQWFNIKAFPFFDKMDQGSRCLLHYNWQLGAGGKWIAIGFQAGGSGGQQYPAAYARCQPAADFDCSPLGFPGEINDVPLNLDTLEYLSPDPNSLDWDEDAISAGRNQFGLSGTTESWLLLMYNRDDTSYPIIAQVSHTCQTVLKRGVSTSTLPSGDCQINFPTHKINAPRQDPFANFDDVVQFRYYDMVDRIWWDNDDCTLYYNTRPICALPAPQVGTGPGNGIPALNLKNIRETCLPCDACPCECASFDSTIELMLTPQNQTPSDCLGFPGPDCKGNCDDLFCVTFTADESNAADPDMAGFCDAGPPERSWKADVTCPNGIGDPNGLKFLICCDGVTNQLAVRILGPNGEVPDESTPPVIFEECGCAVAEFDMDLGGVWNDFCGCPLDATCTVWLWINMWPSKGGWFCEDQVVPPGP